MLLIKTKQVKDCGSGSKRTLVQYTSNAQVRTHMQIIKSSTGGRWPSLISIDVTICAHIVFVRCACFYINTVSLAPTKRNGTNGLKHSMQTNTCVETF